MRTLFFCLSLISISTAAASEQRIVSLAASTTEILYAVGAGQNLVAVDNFSTYPAAAKSLRRVGDHRGFSLEIIASLKPTHIVLVENYIAASDLEPLEKIGAQTIACQNGAFEGGVKATVDCIRKFAARFGDPAKGQKIIDEIITAREAAAEAAERESSVLIILDTAPLYAVGAKNFIHEIFTTAGFRNVMADAPLTYPQISAETLLATNPELVVTFRDSFAEDLRKLYARIPAKRRPPIHVLDEDVFSRPGPRLADAFHALRQIRISQAAGETN